jgi:hypothetical protein
VLLVGVAEEEEAGPGEEGADVAGSLEDCDDVGTEYTEEVDCVV